MQNIKPLSSPRPISRRVFIQHAAVGGSALAMIPVLGCRSERTGTLGRRTGPASRTLALNDHWLFGGKFDAAAANPEFNDSSFSRVTLPHCVARLSWQKWEPADWQSVWIYRRHFALPREFRGLRVFLHCDGVMVGTTPTINGHELPQHLGGYLPSRYEITDWLAQGENVLAVAVDSRWSQVPPEGSPRGPSSIDYLEPGGIIRPVRLQAVPPVFIADVFAKPVNVLQADRRIEVACTIDAATLDQNLMAIQVELRDGLRVVSRARQPLSLEKTGQTEVSLTLSNLGNVALWDVDAPNLYEVVATLYVGNEPVHDYRVRVGLRDARFEVDGFFLNGRRRRLFGLDRHELFPYVGYAMPSRVMRRDAEMIRREFNCNIVRCSHYPQNEAFLDACDELGLMVWEEPPGWQYLGDDTWKDLVVRDVGDMVRRDRNHPAIVIWGVRVNESHNDPPLYQRTKEVAKTLDGSRPTSGSMTTHSTKDWVQDVFAFDDYHAEPDGSVGIREPLPGVPYMLAEAVGQFNYSRRKGFDCKYRRAGDITLQQQQALRHAQAHSRGAANARNCGVIAWCAFDYGSLMNAYDGVKCPGVADIFRIPKLGATFYQAQADPGVRLVIEPDFYWDFGPQTPRGPGKQAAIFSNCNRLELFVDGQPHSGLVPDFAGFPNLKHPPFFADLEMDGADHPELRIDGYVGNRLVLSRSLSSNPAQDQFHLRADDGVLVSDGSDATRLVCGRVDKFGSVRPFMGGEVAFQVNGPGVVVGDNPLQLAEAGGMGAVWIKTLSGNAGRIEVIASHSVLGQKVIRINVARASNV